MKYLTAVKLIDNMAHGKIVKLRKNRVGGISSPTWCMLCNVMFDRGVKTLNYWQDKDNNITIRYDNVTLSTKVVLY